MGTLIWVFIVTLVSALAILQGVTLWHKKDVVKAVLFVGVGLFMSIGAPMYGMVSGISELEQNLPTMLREASPELLQALKNAAMRDGQIGQ
jgi:hypothetical protein